MYNRIRPPKKIRDAKGRCQICESPLGKCIEVHHIRPVSEGGNNSPCNLVHLCPNCHTLTHNGKYSNFKWAFTTRGRILFFDGGPQTRQYPR